MGQKVTPISLRLKNQKNWHSQWIVEKNNYAEILHFDLELRKYLDVLLNNKKISTLQIKINKISKNIYIYIFVHNTFKRQILKDQSNILTHLNSYLINKYNIKLFFLKAHFKLNNYQKNLRYYIYNYLKKKRRRIKDKKILKFLSICQIALTLGKMHIISKYIIRTIKKKKIHRGYLNFINRILKEYFKMNSKILGYKLQIKGRINGSKRKRKLVYQEGQIPLSSLNKNIQYTFDEFITKSGICSVKMWFYLQNSNINKKLFKLKKINGYFKNNSKKILNLKKTTKKKIFNLSKRL